jgi:hypothetical protein
MSSTLRRLRIPLLLFLLAAAPLWAYMPKCYSVCTVGTPCDTYCAWDDGEPATCGDFGICQCQPTSSTTYEVGRNCWDSGYDGWVPILSSVHEVDYGGCQSPTSDCEYEFGSGFENEQECCDSLGGCSGYVC